MLQGVSIRSAWRADAAPLRGGSLAARVVASWRKGSPGRAGTAAVLRQAPAVCTLPGAEQPTRRATVMGGGAAALGVTLSLLGPAAPALAAGGNDAIMQALKQRKQARDVEDGALLARMRRAREQLGRAKTLADVGEYDQARQLLRGGAVGGIRDDLKKLRVYLASVRPTFDRFEELSLTGALEAFDNAMRAVQRGSKEVTAEDIKKDGEMMLLAMDEIVRVINNAEVDLGTARRNEARSVEDCDPDSCSCGGALDGPKRC